ncbi:MAG: hypothetical protein HYX84_05260 [Chloroflexi bacterium]|nr:hypothetical protein [Chloroflexota bacterium]
MAETEEKENRARQNAKCALENIIAVIKHLEHRRECDGEYCNLSDQEIFKGINVLYREGMKATEEEKQEYHDEENALQMIQDDPLSIEVRSGWHTPGEAGESMEYYILLGTGGPALRIIGDLGEHNTPESAHLEYQDWFTSWERTTWRPKKNVRQCSPMRSNSTMASEGGRHATDELPSNR